MRQWYSKLIQNPEKMLDRLLEVAQEKNNVQSNLWNYKKKVEELKSIIKQQQIEINMLKSMNQPCTIWQKLNFLFR